MFWQRTIQPSLLVFIIKIPSNSNIKIQVYSCTSFLFFKLEYAWILSRERNFRNTEKFNQVMEMAVNDYGFKTKNLIRCEQDDCKVDFTREGKNGELKPV